MGKSAVGESSARRIVAQRSNGVCEVCAAAPASDYQHRKNRSQGGGWSPSNALKCCHRCHMRMHADPDTAVRNGWTVSSYATPADTPVWIRPWCGQNWYLLADDGTYEPVVQ